VCVCGCVGRGGWSSGCGLVAGWYVCGVGMVGT